MIKYTAENTLRVAKRYNNTKRTYLLVNPLQAKHIPISPTEALAMMRTLGKKLAQKYPNAKLIVGFAETATAIGAAVSEYFGSDCVYIHTTREDIPDCQSWIYFSEEHSHAVEQKLCADKLIELFKTTSQIIFVDDELSTGKTLINIVEQLKKQYPVLKNTEMIAASILNRLTQENTKRLDAAGITAEYLVKLPDENYIANVENIEVTAAQSLFDSPLREFDYIPVEPSKAFMNPRIGVCAEKYKAHCQCVAESAIESIMTKIQLQSRILILGTEECMYPALILGELIEKKKLAESVVCHATTRSPIGICKQKDYPIFEGYKIHSFYDTERETYIYNLNYYDTAIIISDTTKTDNLALANLSEALRIHGCGKLFFMKGERHV